MRTVVFCGLMLAAVAGCTALSAAQRGAAPVRANLTRVEAMISCSGARTPTSMAEIKSLGFAAVINLREVSEPSAFVNEETADAKAAGVNYVHLPFNAAMLDPTVVDRFLSAVSAPANQPAFIHCTVGHRAVAMWMIKRVVVDKWDVTAAAVEATGLGLAANTPLHAFARDQIQARTK